MTHREEAINEIKEQVRQMEQRLLDLKKVANVLSQLEGDPSIYSDAEMALPSGIESIRCDQWYKQPLCTAVREYLNMRQTSKLGPATIAEIHDGLRQGGYAFKAKGADNAKRGLRDSLSKASAVFHRLPNGQYGLVDWYPEVRADRERKASDRSRTPKGNDHTSCSRSSAVKPSLSRGHSANGQPRSQAMSPREVIESVNHRHIHSDGTPGVEDAVREALGNMAGKFKKQDVVLWIATRYPEFRANARRVSITTMITKLKDEFGLKVVESGKGGKPNTYRRSKKMNSTYRRS